MFGTMRIIFFSRAGSKREPGPIPKAGVVRVMVAADAMACRGTRLGEQGG